MRTRTITPARTRLAAAALLLAAGLAVRGEARARLQDGAAAEPAATQATPVEPATTWSIFRGDRGLGGVAAGALPDRLALLWTAEAGGAITSSPVVADGRVYFGADDHLLHCVEAVTGAPLWTGATEDIVEAPPLVVDGAVYVGSSDFYLYAFDAATGERHWRTETDDKILGGANYVRTDDGLLIVVGSYDTKLYGLDAADGSIAWTYTTENYVNGTPAIDGDRIAFGGCDARLHVVSASKGERLASWELGPDAHVAGSIALAGGRAYFGHYGNEFVCVDLETGETVWRYGGRRQPFFSSPAITADRLVFGGRDKQLHCVRRADGEPLWTFPTRRKVDSSPVVVGGEVVFGSGDGRMYVLDLETGEERWSFDIGEAVVSSPAVVDGRVYVGANDGRLYAFGAPETDEREPGGER